MLATPTPFPQVGSYALLTDLDLPQDRQRPELVRVMENRAGTMAWVAFPNRDGAGGTKLVPREQLVDPTPLSDAETREMHDLERELRGRTPIGAPDQIAAKFDRVDTLRSRHLAAALAEPLIAEARRRAPLMKRFGASVGERV